MKLRIVVLAAAFICSQSLFAQEFFRYRIWVGPEAGVLRELPDSSSEALAQIPRGAAVMETGMRGRPIVVSKSGREWIQVAYFGDVGWVDRSLTTEPEKLPAASGAVYEGHWRSTLSCRIPSFLYIMPGGTFVGSHCIHCTLEGCPESLSGTWEIEQGFLCLKERKGQKACFTIFEGILTADPSKGFIWEYHGASVLSGLVR